MSTDDVPKVDIGDVIVVPSYLYIDRGEDDVCGGLATVVRMKVEWGSRWVYVNEVPGRGYNWDIIGPDQDRLAAEYGHLIAEPCPEGKG